MYLIIKRHLQITRLATKEIVDLREFENAGKTIESIGSAVLKRIARLRGKPLSSFSSRIQGYPQFRSRI